MATRELNYAIGEAVYLNIRHDRNKRFRICGDDDDTLHAFDNWCAENKIMCITRGVIGLGMRQGVYVDSTGKLTNQQLLDKMQAWLVEHGLTERDHW